MLRHQITLSSRKIPLRAAPGGDNGERRVGDAGGYEAPLEQIANVARITCYL